MAKFLSDNAIDAALEYVSDNAATLHICQGAPADYAEATTDLGTGSGKSLGSISLAGGDFSISDGGTDGRRLVVAAKSGIDIDITGDANHAAIVKDSATAELLAYTDMTEQAVTSGGTANLASFTLTGRDVVAPA